jgi:phage gp36-like protein
MSYASEADLDQKWGREIVDLSANDAGTGARDPSRIAASLAAAAAIIDGYLARRYRLPLAPTAVGVTLLRNAACDLALGQLCNTPGTRNEIVIDAEKRALAFLRDVADGKAAIPVVTPDAAQPEVAPNEPVVVADGRMFTRTRLRSL